MVELTEEDIAAEAPEVASRLIAWFRDRLLSAEADRAAAVENRVEAEDDRRAADAARGAAVEARESAEDHRRAAERNRSAAEQRVIEVEHLLVASEELAEQLQQALHSRIVIEQAKGYLAARHDVTVEVAFEAMRRHARNNHAALRDVAAEAITGSLRLEL